MASNNPPNQQQPPTARSGGGIGRSAPIRTVGAGVGPPLGGYTGSFIFIQRVVHVLYA